MTYLVFIALSFFLFYVVY